MKYTSAIKLPGYYLLILLIAIAVGCSGSTSSDSDFRLNVNIEPEGAGTVSPDGGSYTAGEQITLQAEAAEGWSFSGWKNDVVSDQNPLQFSIEQNMVITAVFISDQPVVSLVSPDSTFLPGQVAVFHVEGFVLDEDSYHVEIDQVTYPIFPDEDSNQHLLLPIAAVPAGTNAIHFPFLELQDEVSIQIGEYEPIQNPHTFIENETTQIKDLLSSIASEYQLTELNELVNGIELILNDLSSYSELDIEFTAYSLHQLLDLADSELADLKFTQSDACSNIVSNNINSLAVISVAAYYTGIGGMVTWTGNPLGLIVAGGSLYVILNELDKGYVGQLFDQCLNIPVSGSLNLSGSFKQSSSSMFEFVSGETRSFELSGTFTLDNNAASVLSELRQLLNLFLNFLPSRLRNVIFETPTEETRPVSTDGFTLDILQGQDISGELVTQGEQLQLTFSFTADPPADGSGFTFRLLRSTDGFEIISEGHLAKGSEFYPTVETIRINDVTSYTAVFYGRVTDEGNSPVNQRGFCWDTEQNPGVHSNCSLSQQNTDDFSLSVSDLEPGTQYYVVAFASNSEGQAFGDVLSFETPDPEPVILNLVNIDDWSDLGMICPEMPTSGTAHMSIIYNGDIQPQSYLSITTSWGTGSETNEVNLSNLNYTDSTIFLANGFCWGSEDTSLSVSIQYIDSINNYSSNSISRSVPRPY